MSDLRAAHLLRLGLQVAVALGLLLGVQALAHLPLGAPPEGAAIRLAVRTSAGKLEICRDVPPEELAQLPIHMRQSRICEVQPVAYRLTLSVDGVPLRDIHAERRGMRSDRALSIDDLVSVAAGPRTLVVALEPEVPTGTPEAAAAVLPRGELRQTIDLPAGRIALVTWGASAGLTVRQ
ncbi:MAG: hypothetical protein QG573_717 [Acidobacteriota bacterium]|nr:hypothetical protein [Acidobacteriota bacterium]